MKKMKKKYKIDQFTKEY